MHIVKAQQEHCSNIAEQKIDNLKVHHYVHGKQTDVSWSMTDDLLSLKVNLTSLNDEI